MDKEELVNLRDSAVRHYDRMIAYAEKVSKEISPTIHADHLRMNREIGEHWGPHYCGYCESHRGGFIRGCFACPLNSKVSLSCCNGLHAEMCDAKTWEEWLPLAKEVRQYIIVHGLVAILGANNA